MALSIDENQRKPQDRKGRQATHGKLSFLARKDRETHCLHQVSVGYMSCEGTKAQGMVVCQLEVAHLEP